MSNTPVIDTIFRELPTDSPEWGTLFDQLHTGFFVDSTVNVNVRVFIRDALGFADDYIENRISTVFLDFEPVDDIDAAIVREGSRLTLSGAMPGLVGAIMRRKSFYSAMRDTISHKKETVPVGPPGPGRVFVKLFNLVMAERGRDVFGRGIIVEGAAASALVPDSTRAVREPGELVLVRITAK